jgi:hypothetical protein
MKLVLVPPDRQSVEEKDWHSQSREERLCRALEQFLSNQQQHVYLLLQMRRMILVA